MTTDTRTPGGAPLDLDGLAELARAATPGPWTNCSAPRCVCGSVWSLPVDAPVASTNTDSEEEGFRSTGERKAADAAFIAAANPSTVLRLIDLARLGEDSPRRDAYWKSVLRSLGARPVTCSACGGSGTVNSADTEPCETCDGGGSEWVRG